MLNLQRNFFEEHDKKAAGNASAINYETVFWKKLSAEPKIRGYGKRIPEQDG